MVYKNQTEPFTFSKSGSSLGFPILTMLPCPIHPNHSSWTSLSLLGIFFFQLELIPLLNKLHLGADFHRPKEKMHLAFAEINIVQQCPSSSFREVNLSLEERLRRLPHWRWHGEVITWEPVQEQTERMATCCFPVPCQVSAAKQRHPHSREFMQTTTLTQTIISSYLDKCSSLLSGLSDIFVPHPNIHSPCNNQSDPLKIKIK